MNHQSLTQFLLVTGQPPTEMMAQHEGSLTLTFIMNTTQGPLQKKWRKQGENRDKRRSEILKQKDTKQTTQAGRRSKVHLSLLSNNICNFVTNTITKKKKKKIIIIIIINK